jgi:hypothetical protein
MNIIATNVIKNLKKWCVFPKPARCLPAHTVRARIPGRRSLQLLLLVFPLVEAAFRRAAAAAVLEGGSAEPVNLPASRELVFDLGDRK